MNKKYAFYVTVVSTTVGVDSVKTLANGDGLITYAKQGMTFGPFLTAEEAQEDYNKRLEANKDEASTTEKFVELTPDEYHTVYYYGPGFSNVDALDFSAGKIYAWEIVKLPN